MEDPELYFETLEKLKEAGGEGRGLEGSSFSRVLGTVGSSCGFEAVSNADADAYSSIFSMNSAAATPPQAGA